MLKNSKHVIWRKEILFTDTCSIKSKCAQIDFKVPVEGLSNLSICRLIKMVPAGKIIYQMQWKYS